MADYELKKEGSIRNYPKGHPTKQEQEEGKRLPDKLDFAKIWKGGTIEPGKAVRLDGQKPFGDWSNLQIQINGVQRSSSGGTTLAGVLVHNSARDLGTEKVEERKKVLDLVKQGLRLSLETKANYKVQPK